jgi:hypothetical protein
MSEDDEFYRVLLAGPDAEPPSDDYVRFDERKDVLASMDLLELISPQLEANPSLWKWAIISAQSALQGAMVCALADSAGTSVLTKKSGSKLLAWLQAEDDKRGDPPKERLAEFNVLLEQYLSAGLVLTQQQEKEVRRLHEYFRNTFSHFIPMGSGYREVGPAENNWIRFERHRRINEATARRHSLG